MEAVTAANVGDDWHSGSDVTPGGGSVSVPVRRRQDDAIDSMLQVPAQMFPTAGEVHPGVTLSFQRRGGGLGHPPPAGHPPPVLPPAHPPHFPSLHAPLAIGANGNSGRYPQLPALAPPPQKRNSVGSGSSGGTGGGGNANGTANGNTGGGGGTAGVGVNNVNVNVNPNGAGVGGGVVGLPVVSNGAGVGGGGVVVPGVGVGVNVGMRPLNELMALPSKCSSSAERRRVRKVLLSRKRTRRSGTPAAPVGEIEAEIAAKRPALDTAALARLDKKQIRQIKNRDVALKARQKAKAKVQRLESENSNLKTKAMNLERENNHLRAQIESLKSSITGVNGVNNGVNGVNGDPNDPSMPSHPDVHSVNSDPGMGGREQSWTGDVSLESMVPGP